MEFKGSIKLFLLLVTMRMSNAQQDLAASEVSRANTIFTSDFYSVLNTASPSSNLIFSPFSLSACIGMLKAGAAGATANQIQKVMHYPDDQTLFKGYNTQLRGLKSNVNFTLETANSVYPKKGFKLNPKFESIVRDDFHANVEQLDFANGPASAKIINGFVEKTTNNRIKDLISPGDLSTDTRLVLVNAIYFKGLWKNKFDTKNTVKEKFHISPTKEVDVDMMKITADFKFNEIRDLDAKVISLPYQGDRLSMVIILPNQEDGLVELENKLKGYDLGSLQSQLYERKVELSMPKFKLESEIDLKGPLESLGLKSIFDQGSADLSGIPDKSNQEPLYVSKAIQKAFLEVNEEGSEAAAATGTLIELKIGTIGPKLVQLKLNHPFITFIQDSSDQILLHHNNHNHNPNNGQQHQAEDSYSSNILFMSRLINPTQTETTTVGLLRNTNNNNDGVTSFSVSLAMSFIPILLAFLL